MAYLPGQCHGTDRVYPMLPPRNRHERLMAVTVAMTSSGEMLLR